MGNLASSNLVSVIFLSFLSSLTLVGNFYRSIACGHITCGCHCHRPQRRRYKISQSFFKKTVSPSVVTMASQGTALCTPLPSPSRSRCRPVPLRLQSLGVDPSLLVGKVLRKLSRSSKHPTLTLDFSDNTTFQILVDGYDPVHRCVYSPPLVSKKKAQQCT